MSEAFEKDNSSKAADAQIGFLSFLAQVYCSVWVAGSILQDFARWQNTKLWIKMMMMMVAVVTCMWQCKIAKHDEDTDWHGFGWVGFTRCPKMVCRLQVLCRIRADKGAVCVGVVTSELVWIMVGNKVVVECGTVDRWDGSPGEVNGLKSKIKIKIKCHFLGS